MRFMAGFVYAEVYAFKSNTFVARVLHFSAFMLQVICMLVCVKRTNWEFTESWNLKEVFECKKYLYGVPDMGSKLLFRFRSGTHGLN